MSRNQLSFFATIADLDSLIRRVESARRLHYALTGLFDSPNPVTVQCLLDAPNSGCGAVGDVNQSPGYLVAGREISIEVRPVPQRRGGVKYAVDQNANPKTIAFRPGGVFGESCLIAGQVGTTSDDPSSLDLFQSFSKEIRHQFTKIRSFYVGKEAGELL